LIAGSKQHEIMQLAIIDFLFIVSLSTFQAVLKRERGFLDIRLVMMYSQAAVVLLLIVALVPVGGQTQG
jgi:hypothetical protein